MACVRAALTPSALNPLAETHQDKHLYTPTETYVKKKKKVIAKMTSSALKLDKQLKGK